MALNEGYARNRLIELGYEIPDDSKRGQQPLTELVKSEIARWSPIMNAVQDAMGRAAKKLYRSSLL
jgi:hypothetical protein